MEEIQLGLRLQGVARGHLVQWLQSWQLGQVMQARVIDSSLPGSLLLRTAGYQFTASADVQVDKGVLLNLQVSGLYPRPSLKIFDTPVQRAVRANPLERQVQLLMPRQGSVVAPLIAFLDPAQRVNLLSLLGVRNGVIDPDFDYFSQRGLPRTPEALRKALLESGLFLESELMRLAPSGGVFSQIDMKAMLFRLLRRVNQRIGQPGGAGADKFDESMLLNLHRVLEGAIATITLNQLGARDPAGCHGFIWTFDAPFRIRDALHRLSLSIRREGAAAGDVSELEEWKAVFRLELPWLGSVQAELFLRGNRVSVIFDAERDTTRVLLEGHLHELAGALEHRGLVVSVVRFHFGDRHEDGESELGLPSLDEKI